MATRKGVRKALGRLTPKGFTERNPKVIGAVALALIAALVLAALVLNGSIFNSSYRVEARFPNAVGLTHGAKVLVAGVAVGTVAGVHVEGNSVLVDLDINDGVALPADTSAKINVETLLGVTGVNLQPGSDWSHPLRPGALITDTSAPVEFFDVQSSAGNLLSASDAHALANVVQELAAVTSGKKAQISEIVGGLDRFTGTVAARQQQVSSLIDAAEQLSGTLAAKDKELASVVDDLDTVVAGLAGHSSQLGALIDETELAASETASLVSRNNPRLQQVLDALHADLQVLGQHQVDLAQSVAYAGAAVNGFQSVGYSGPTNSPNNWANIFVNLASVAPVDGVLGSCGALDQALDVALGPDPLACRARTGPVPGATGSSASTRPATSSPAGGGPSKTTTPSSIPAGNLPGTAGGGGLWSLFGPLGAAAGGK